MVKIATGYSALASFLREHIRTYNPWGGHDTIGTVDHLIFIDSEDAEAFLDAHYKGQLEELLEGYGKGDYREDDFQKWYNVAAINNFFSTEQYEKYRKYIPEILK